MNWAPGHDTDGSAAGDPQDHRAEFSALLEDSVDDLYENAPCGYLSTDMDGVIAKINTTLLRWLGYSQDELIGRRHFADLLTVGGKIYHETHFAQLLRMQGEIGGIALDLKTAAGDTLPVLVSSTVKTGSQGQPLLIRTTVFDAQDRRAYERELLRARQAAEAERDQVAHLAATLQQTLLPPELPDVPGLELQSTYHPAAAELIGGDFYDVFPLAGNRWAMFLGDVSGKGADAAVITSLIRYTIRTAAVYDPEPVSVLRTLNATMCEQPTGEPPHFCTLVYGILVTDSSGAELTLATGGHPPGVHLRADGTARFVEACGGQLVGILPDASFATVTVRLDAGDTLLLYTDGITEARVDPHRNRYGEDSLLSFAAGLAPVDAAGLIRAITGLLASFGTGRDDDTAAIAMGVPAR